MGAVASKTYGASFDVLVKQFFGLKSLISQTAVEEIKQHLESDDNVSASHWIEEKHGRFYGKSLFTKETERLMLLPINPDTPRSKIFTELNNEVMHFLTACVGASGYGKVLFSNDIGDIVWRNLPTRVKFELLWNLLEPLNTGERQEILDLVVNNQNLALYYPDRLQNPPKLPEDLGSALGEVTKHLFSHTCKLTGVETCCVLRVFRGTLMAFVT